MSIIQQLEDLKEWSQNPERYERRLAFRSSHFPRDPVGTIPVEFDELSDREQEYYRTGPWSTREDYRKGQLVQHGPGRQGYSGRRKGSYIRTELYAGGTVIKENGAKLVQLVNEGYSANAIATKLKYNRKTVLEAIKAINSPEINTGTLKFKPSEDIIKLTVNKSGKNLKDPKVIERVQAIADANPTLNKTDLVEKNLITQAESRIKSIEFGFEGKHWSDEGRKRANKAYRDRIIKYSDPSIEKLTYGDYDVQKHHGGAKFEKVRTGNLMAMDASMNRHIVHEFEKKIDDIQYKQRANNLNRNISIEEKTKIFKNLEAEEAALRAKYPEYTKYKSTLVYKPSALSKTGFMHKEKMLDPSMTFSKGEAGQDIALKKASKKEAKEIVKMSNKAWRTKVNAGKAETLAKALELAGEKICQPGKVAEGGRIGFAGKCGVALARDNPNLYMRLAKESKPAMELFKSGQIGKYLRGAKSWTLANMGPAGWIGGELLIMGLGTLYEVSQGKGWKEGLDTWTGLGGHAGMAEDRLKEIGREQGWSEQQIYDALKFNKLLKLDQEAEEKEWELEEALTRQEIGGTARYKSSRIPSVTGQISGALYDEEPSYPDYSKSRWLREKGYRRGEYQDPQSLRNLKEEVPEIWAEGDALYKSLMNFPTSVTLHQELQDRKKYEELKEKNRIWAWTKKRIGIGQQLEAPEPSDLGPFERSPGHPGYTGAFTKWKPDSYAGGGIAGLSGGKRFGPPPLSGPDPQGEGLFSQFNRVKKLTG